MRITYFKIENFRNIRFAECRNVPDFMVICGGNGSGKTALLEALMTAKEHAGGYGQFKFDPRAVSSLSEKSTIQIELSFNEQEREFHNNEYGSECPNFDTIIVEILKGGRGRVTKRSNPTAKLLGYYGRSLGSPGFFDYFNAYRQVPKVDLSSWTANSLSEQVTKQTLARETNKFELTKRYLADLKMQDLQEIQTILHQGKELESQDSLHEIRMFFNDFFSPMKFNDVYINQAPFGFTIDTPMGEIDIDDLSSGEKEIFNTYIRFHQLKPFGSVILLDEADAHLHPDLERRYLEFLRTFSENNQLIITTHSPEMMIAAGSNSLYTIIKQQPTPGTNQLARVTKSEQLHNTLSELMGSRGLVSFNQRIIFIEGTESSADRYIYEALYPPSQFNISFVPAGNSSTVRGVAEKVNSLLEESSQFQFYYSIIDGDIDRPGKYQVSSEKLFQLPVYHVENFLLVPDVLFEATSEMLGNKCPYINPNDLVGALKNLILEDGHLMPYTKALLDSEIARRARQAYDVFYQGDLGSFPHSSVEFADILPRAKRDLAASISDDTWMSKCKGRALLKSFCAANGLNYIHFRNLLTSKLDSPPDGLAQIMQKIFEN